MTLLLVNADEADDTKARAPREAMSTIMMTEDAESFIDQLNAVLPMRSRRSVMMMCHHRAIFSWAAFDDATTHAGQTLSPAYDATSWSTIIICIMMQFPYMIPYYSYTSGLLACRNQTK